MLERPVATEAGVIQCPTSIVWGDRDTIFGHAEQEELMRRIPAARLHIFRDVGHSPHWEAPDRFMIPLLGTAPPPH
jgi:pimeloyl-ACP methyl ester carboxylesterase